MMGSYQHFRYDVDEDVALEEATARVTGRCPFSGTKWALTVPAIGLARYLNGTNAQDAFPALTPAQCELIITGITNPQWQSKIAGRRGDDDDGEVNFLRSAGKLS